MSGAWLANLDLQGEQCEASEKRRRLLASLLHCGELAAKPALCNSSEARSMLSAASILFGGAQNNERRQAAAAG